ncbi:hypothetical protein, partial [Raoultella ornithinolytica]|uniref:hypothetical protein n=1 Tax=Raoultella ornithinolytica TaxID=54291 RepID=UPI001005CBCD
EIEYYKKGYSSEYRTQVSILNDIKSSEGKVLSFNNKTLDFDNISQAYVNKLVDNIDSYLSKKNTIVLSSTFEECLINESSLPLFLLWLHNSNGIDVDSILKNLVGLTYFNNGTLATYLRLIFNGKATTGLVYKHLQKKDFKLGRRLLNIVEREIQKKCFYTGKTGGWVTSFLDFAIAHLELEAAKTSTSFDSKFSLIFPEFYSMIDKLRLDRG